MKQDAGSGQTDAVLVIGVGNDFRRDDAVGLTVVRLLRERVGGGVVLTESRGDGSRLCELWRSWQNVILVDSSEPGTSPGEIRRMDASRMPSNTALPGSSSHGFGVTEAIGISRRLGCLPDRLIVYAIEAQDVGMGEGLTSPVALAVEEVARRVLLELSTLQRRRKGRHPLPTGSSERKNASPGKDRPAESERL